MLKRLLSSALIGVALLAAGAGLAAQRSAHAACTGNLYAAEGNPAADQSRYNFHVFLGPSFAGNAAADLHLYNSSSTAGVNTGVQLISAQNQSVYYQNVYLAPFGGADLSIPGGFSGNFRVYVSGDGNFTAHVQQWFTC